MPSSWATASRRRWTTLPGLDDRLTRELERIARPADPSGVLDRVQTRRVRRARVRRTTSALLAVVVIATTVAGFSVLTSLFSPDRRGSLAITPYGAEGVIVTCGDENGGQICRIDAQALARGTTSEDLVRLTDFSDVVVSSPAVSPEGAVSPDGLTVVFELHDPPGTSREETAELWTIGTDGKGLQRLTPRGSGFTEPSWGPTGLLVAVANPGVSNDAALAILDPSAGPSPHVATIELPGLRFASSPRWSPDNDRILFAARAASITDLYTVEIDGSGLRNLTNSADTEYTPTWSPDGRSIAYWVGSPSGVEIRICAVDCVNPRPLLDPEGRPIYGSLPVWSPDGGWITFQVDSGPTTEVHAVRIDGSEERTLASSVGEMAWIPLVTGGTTISPEPTFSPSPSRALEGRDIGLGFNLCHVQRLGGIDFLGDGAAGIAWVGVRTRDNGTCPAQGGGYRGIVAADFNGDEIADSWWGGIEYCLFCEPFDVTDLDADGDQELVVLESSSSTPAYLVLTTRLDSGGEPQLRPVTVAAPGDEAARLPAGEPLTIVTGGDEGFSGWVRCEGFPAAPVLVVTWRDHPIEGATMEVHETKLVLREDGAAHITETNDYSAPVGTRIPGVSDAPACGVDWQIWT